MQRLARCLGLDRMMIGLVIGLSFAAKASGAEDFELPLIHPESPYYYVPEVSASASEKSGLFKGSSYSSSPDYRSRSWSILKGYQRVRFRNIHLVHKTGFQRKALFDAPVNITSFFYVLPEKRKEHKEFPIHILYIETLERKPELAKEKESVGLVKLHASDFQGNKKILLNPGATSVSEYEFDLERGRLILKLQKDVNQDGKVEANEPHYIAYVDLSRPEAARPLLE